MTMLVCSHVCRVRFPQGNWNEGVIFCAMPKEKQVVVPLERNGQTIALHQRKFYVAIPFIYSTAGYGFLLNMPGNGEVTIGTLVRMSLCVCVRACVCVCVCVKEKEREREREMYRRGFCVRAASITLCEFNHTLDVFECELIVMSRSSIRVLGMTCD